MHQQKKKPLKYFQTFSLMLVFSLSYLKSRSKRKGVELCLTPLAWSAITGTHMTPASVNLMCTRERVAPAAVPQKKMSISCSLAGGVLEGGCLWLLSKHVCTWRGKSKRCLQKSSQQQREREKEYLSK